MHSMGIECHLDCHCSVTHIHKQNGLEKLFIISLQLIARSLVMKAKFLASDWDRAKLQVESLVHIR